MQEVLICLFFFSYDCTPKTLCHMKLHPFSFVRLARGGIDIVTLEGLQGKEWIPDGLPWN